MRKYFSVLLTVGALCLFTTLAMAQTSSNSNSSSGSSMQSSTTNSSQNSSSSDMQNGQSNTSSNAAEKTLDGCIVKEQNDYFIQPASGEREHLSGSQDLSSQVGHHVRVQGNEQNVTASNANGTVSDRTSTSGSASSETQNNAAGSIAGNAGSPNASGTSAATSNNWTGKDFLVTRIETVSESCPADIQSKIDGNKSH